jgi:methyl-accepting chemotaxis protein
MNAQIDEVAASAAALTRLARILNDLVSQFKLETDYPLSS